MKIPARRKRKESVVLEQRIPLAEAIIPGLGIEIPEEQQQH